MSTRPLPPARPSLSQAPSLSPGTTLLSSPADPRLAPTEVLTTTKPVATSPDADAADLRAAGPVARVVDVEGSLTADVAALLVDVAGPRPPMRETPRDRRPELCSHFLISGVAITGHHLIKILIKSSLGSLWEFCTDGWRCLVCLLLLIWRIPGILHRGENLLVPVFLFFIA